MCLALFIHRPRCTAAAPTAALSPSICWRWEYQLQNPNSFLRAITASLQLCSTAGEEVTTEGTARGQASVHPLRGTFCLLEPTDFGGSHTSNGLSKTSPMKHTCSTQAGFWRGGGGVPIGSHAAAGGKIRLRDPEGTSSTNHPSDGAERHQVLAKSLFTR